MFAYVVNLASDGTHYWVFAHITPSFITSGHAVGYHSNRRVADPAAVAACGALYGRLVTIDGGQTEGGNSVGQGLAQMAEVPRVEATRVLEVLRTG